MAVGYTSSFDPVTGERKETRFQYEPTPAPPPNYGMSSMNPEAVRALYQNSKIEDANKAMSAAIQFQGLRGYQEALKQGESAEKALTRYGPMMFYSKPSAIAPMMKATMPEKVPQITPYQRESLDLQNRRLNQTPTMTPYQAEQIALRKAAAAKPPEPKTMTIRETLEATPATPEIPAVEFKQRGSGIFDRLIPDRKAQAYQPAMPAQGERTVTRKVPVTGATPAPTLSEQAAKTAPPMPEVGDIVKGYRFKGGKPSDKNNWEKVQ